MEALGFCKLPLSRALEVVEESTDAPPGSDGVSPICRFFGYDRGRFGVMAHSGVVLSDPDNWDGLPATPRPEISGLYVRIPDGAVLALLGLAPTPAGKAAGVRPVNVVMGGWTLRTWDPANPQEVPGIPGVADSVLKAAAEAGCSDAILIECVALEAAAYRMAADSVLEDIGCSVRFYDSPCGVDEIRDTVAAAFRHRGLAGKGGLN